MRIDKKEVKRMKMLKVTCLESTCQQEYPSGKIYGDIIITFPDGKIETFPFGDVDHLSRSVGIQNRVANRIARHYGIRTQEEWRKQKVFLERYVYYGSRSIRRERGVNQFNTLLIEDAEVTSRGINVFDRLADVQVYRDDGTR